MTRQIEVGERFNRLCIIGRPFMAVDSKGQYRRLAVCECDCGKFRLVRTESLSSGHSGSCGCLRPYGTLNLKHGHGTKGPHGKFEPLYRVWMAMKSRCHNPNRSNFKWYGARGITVCDEWRKNFGAFRAWCMSNGYQAGLELDRRENSLGYAPSNCRFVTHKANCYNRPQAENYVKQCN